MRVGSNETDKFDKDKEKVVILDKLKLLKHGTNQRSAAEQLNVIGFACFTQYSWHLEDELGPTGFIIQPLISATLVRSGGGWYNRILLHLDTSRTSSVFYFQQSEISFYPMRPWMDCFEIGPELDWKKKQLW